MIKSYIENQIKLQTLKKVTKIEISFKKLPATALKLPPPIMGFFAQNCLLHVSLSF
jgi:hypothetical protein